MKFTEKEKLELLAIEQKLDELRRMVMNCETITSVSFRIDQYGYGYDQRIDKEVEE